VALPLPRLREAGLHLLGETRIGDMARRTHGIALRARDDPGQIDTALHRGREFPRAGCLGFCAGAKGLDLQRVSSLDARGVCAGQALGRISRRALR